MTEQREYIQEKYHEELKWGSYSFLLFWSFLLMFSLFLFLSGLKDVISEQLSVNLLIIVYIGILLCCWIKCLTENIQNKKIGFLIKIWIVLRIMCIQYFYSNLMSTAIEVPTIMIVREKFVYNDDELLNENESNLFKDLIRFLKNKKQ